jgi:hypothetical protein
VCIFCFILRYYSLSFNINYINIYLFSLRILVKGKATHFNNILKRNSKIIGFRAVQEGIYHNMVDS